MDNLSAMNNQLKSWQLGEISVSFFLSSYHCVEILDVPTNFK